MTIKINPAVDLKEAAKTLKSKGRVQVRDFLETDSANALFECLRDNCVWHWAYYEGATRKITKGQELSRMTGRRQREFMQKIYSQARDQYQQTMFEFRFGNDIAELDETRRENLKTVSEFLNSDTLRDAVNAVAGTKCEALDDLHAQWQSRDHYRNDTLTAPDNPDSGVLFMLDLARDWRPDWNGTMSFPNDDGGIDESWPARFNALNVIAAPARHALSYVAPYVGGFRLSLWGRAA